MDRLVTEVSTDEGLKPPPSFSAGLSSAKETLVLPASSSSLSAAGSGSSVYNKAVVDKKTVLASLQHWLKINRKHNPLYENYIVVYYIV